MIDFDLSHIPYGGHLSDEEQKEFERRARIVDDNNDPPIVIYRNGVKVDLIDD